MQGLVLQLSRGLLLVLLWLFIYLVLRALKTDVFGNVGMRSSSRGARRGGFLGRGGGTIRHLVVTQGALAGTRITLSEQPVLLGRADNCTLVIDDDYASNQHAKLSPHGPDWFLEDLGSTNGTYLDRSRVTTPVKVAEGTPIRIGKTELELRAWPPPSSTRRAPTWGRCGRTTRTRPTPVRGCSRWRTGWAVTPPGRSPASSWWPRWPGSTRTSPV